MVASATMGLVVVIVLSAGPRSEAGEWFRVPDLGGLFAVALGILALLGLALVKLARPQAGSRTPAEVRSLRAVLVLTIIIFAATVWLGPPEAAEEPPTVEVQETVPAVESEIASDSVSEASGTDLSVLALILVIMAVVLVRSWRRSQSATQGANPEVDRELQRELAPAVEAAHHHLSDETDPRTAVLLAYASLESALAHRGRQRHPAETPSEHMARVLADIPVLATPAMRLGKLYQVARFSREVITEKQRHDAARARGQARDALAAAEPGRS
jgi:Na+-transporting methylmalonyl-CoA/oxaloacetate decarboxylase gamma subunit